MLRLTLKQEEVFRLNARIKAESRAADFLRMNFAKQIKEREESVDELVKKVFEFAARFSVAKEINIQKLLAWEVLYGFIEMNPIPIRWIEILEFPDRDEDVKVEYFQKQIMKTKTRR